MSSSSSSTNKRSNNNNSDSDSDSDSSSPVARWDIYRDSDSNFNSDKDSCVSDYDYWWAKQKIAQFGQGEVSTRLRSVLISPTCFTLFRGFNPTAATDTTDTASSPTLTATTFADASTDHASADTLHVEIDGLPTSAVPNLLQSSPLFSTVLSESFDAVAVEREKKEIKKKATKKVEQQSIAKTDAPDKEHKHDGVKERIILKDNDLLESLQTKLQTISEINQELQFSVEHQVDFKELEHYVEHELHSDDFPENTALLFSRKDDQEQATSSSAEKNCEKTPLGIVGFSLVQKRYQNHLTTEKSKWEEVEHQFWEELNQIKRYLCMLRSDSGWKWNNSLLLGVMAATRDLTFSRFAIFVCEPKGDNEWRIALMWRSQLESLQELSEAFGFYLNAVDFLAREGDTLENNIDLTWDYLGPDCSLVTIKDKKYVLRSYDNRVWPCYRSPRVYKNWEKLKATTIPIILQRDDAESNTLEFAAALDGDEAYEKTMLFSKWNKGMGGKVEVIAVPYQEGSHECTSIIHVLSLLLYLKEMHDAGYVHGDVRGRNIVFLDVPEELDVSDFLQRVESTKRFSTNIQRKSGTPQIDGNENEGKVAANDQQESMNQQEVANDLQGAGMLQVDTMDQPSQSDHPPVLANDSQVASIPHDEQANDDDDDDLSCADFLKGRSMDELSDGEKEHIARMIEYMRDTKIANNPKVSIIQEKFKYACLIDFDFGGHVMVDKPTYPPRYQRILSDGHRWQSSAGGDILPAHDVVATTNVLGCLHDIGENTSVAAGIMWSRDLRNTYELIRAIEVASKLMKICPKKAVCSSHHYKQCFHSDD